MFRDLFRNTSIMSVSVAAVLAAGTAGIFTVATAPSQNDMRMNRAAKDDLSSSLSAVFFDSQPIASSGRMINQSSPAALRRVGSERIESQQVRPQRANENAEENQESAPLMKGCESGLSADISTTVPQHPGRCVVRQGALPQYASLR
jgi:hypothetical protein